MLLARPRSEECSARQGPRTRARKGARGRQQDRSRQAQGDGRVRQIRVQHGRGPGGPAAARCPRGWFRPRGGPRPVGIERIRVRRRPSGPTNQRAATAAAPAHRSRGGRAQCAQCTDLPGPVAGCVRASQAAGRRPSGPDARPGRQAGERSRHRGGGRRGARLGAQGRAGGRGQGRSGRPHPGCRASCSAAAGGGPPERWPASRPRRGSAAPGFAGRRSSGCSRRAGQRPASRSRRWRSAPAGA